MASRAISFGFNKQHTTSTLISTPTTVTLFLQSCTAAWVHAWRQAEEETSPAIPAMPQIQLHCLPRSGKSTGRSLALLSRGLASWATIPCMDGVNSLWQLAHLTDLTPSTCWTRGHDIISTTNRGILPFTLRLGSVVQICLTIALSGNNRMTPRPHLPINLSDNRTVWLWSHEVSFSACFHASMRQNLVEGWIDLCNALHTQMILHVNDGSQKFDGKGKYRFFGR